MGTRNIVLLVLIIILAAITIYIVLPNGPGLHLTLGPIDIQRDFEIKQGLDLQGGVQVLLEADLEPGQELEPGSLDVAATIIGNRVNALGVVEPLVQTQGDRRIIVELPGVEDSDQAIATIKETGLLEFIDAGDDFLPPGSIVQTTYPLLESEGAETRNLEPGETVPGLEIEPPTGVVTPSEQTTEDVLPGGPVVTDRVYATILTGAHLKAAAVQRDEQTGQRL
jgi:preprotein translocase subunit SecD